MGDAQLILERRRRVRGIVRDAPNQIAGTADVHRAYVRRYGWVGMNAVRSDLNTLASLGELDKSGSEFGHGWLWSAADRIGVT
jgi:hypothetical protein